MILFHGGVFLLPNGKTGGGEARIILSALLVWAVSALVLLCVTAFALTKLYAGEGAMGYISSALSFLTAVCAGAAVGRSSRGGPIYPALLTAAVLTTALLTIGFIVEGSSIQAAGVLSVVSFTFTGCAFGAVLFGGRKQKSFRQRYRK